MRAKPDADEEVARRILAWRVKWPKVESVLIDDALIAAHALLSRKSPRKKARLAAFDACHMVAENARLDRPEKIGSRRRCGDVIRWKMNNETIDRIQSDIRALMRKEMPK